MAYLDRVFVEVLHEANLSQEMSGKLSRLNGFAFLLTSIVIIALPIVVSAGAATVDDVVKNLRACQRLNGEPL